MKPSIDKEVLNERKSQLPLLTEIKTNEKSSMHGPGVKGDHSVSTDIFLSMDV